ncbi:MAG TPA: hypothetical protein VFU76_01505 [Terriglobales bacterium]|nr:hypothetical protein [Terriglobales bacterium]
MNRLAAARPVLTGTLLCVGVALVAGEAFSGSSSGPVAPLGLILLFALAALHYGRSVGLIGCLLSALVLAWVYPPFNSLEVADPELRANLAYMVIGGSLFALFLPHEPIWASKHDRRNITRHS